MPLQTCMVFALMTVQRSTKEKTHAQMGEENPLVDIGNMEYIYAGYEVTAQVSEEERAASAVA